MKSHEDIEPQDKYYLKGKMFIEQGKFNLAKEAFKKSIKKSPGSLKPHWGISCCCISQENYNEALIWLDGLLDIKPHEESYLVNRATCLKKLERYDEALETIESLLKLDPNNLHALTLKGNISWDNNNLDQAIEYYKKVIEIDPTYMLAWKNLSEVLVETGRKESVQEYIELYHDAARKNPEIAGFKKITIPNMQNKGLIFYEIVPINSTIKDVIEKAVEFAEIFRIDIENLKMFPVQGKMIGVIENEQGAWNEFHRITKIEPIIIAPKEQSNKEIYKFCGSCGTQNKESYKFCSKCGKAI